MKDVQVTVVKEIGQYAVIGTFSPAAIPSGTILLVIATVWRRFTPPLEFSFSPCDGYSRLFCVTDSGMSVIIDDRFVSHVTDNIAWISHDRQYYKAC